jgi:hypothetical protein
MEDELISSADSVQWIECGAAEFDADRSLVLVLGDNLRALHVVLVVLCCDEAVEWLALLHLELLEVCILSSSAFWLFLCPFVLLPQ